MAGASAARRLPSWRPPICPEPASCQLALKPASCQLALSSRAVQPAVRPARRQPAVRPASSQHAVRPSAGYEVRLAHVDGEATWTRGMPDGRRVGTRQQQRRAQRAQLWRSFAPPQPCVDG
eukprot:5916825-Prymnesium_polylepis.1